MRYSVAAGRLYQRKAEQIGQRDEKADANATRPSGCPPGTLANRSGRDAVVAVPALPEPIIDKRSVSAKVAVTCLTERSRVAEWWGESARAHDERIRWVVIDQQTYVGFKGTEQLKVMGGDATAEHARQKSPIIRAGTKGDPGASVRHDGSPQLRRQLAEVLMRHGEGHPQAAGLGEQVAEVDRQSEVVLNFVDDHHHRVAASEPLPCSALHGLPKLCQQERSDQLRGLATDDPGVQVGQDDPALVEQIIKPKPRARLTDQLADGGPAEEGSCLVEHRRDDQMTLSFR
jgi:hypothetical protein